MAMAMPKLLRLLLLLPLLPPTHAPAPRPATHRGHNRNVRHAQLIIEHVSEMTRRTDVSGTARTYSTRRKVQTYPVSSNGGSEVSDTAKTRRLQGGARAHKPRTRLLYTYFIRYTLEPRTGRRRPFTYF